MTQDKTIEDIINILASKLELTICANCAFEERLKHNDYPCNHCAKQGMMWQISYDTAEYLARRIIQLLGNTEAK